MKVPPAIAQKHTDRLIPLICDHQIGNAVLIEVSNGNRSGSRPGGVLSRGQRRALFHGLHGLNH
jgi:hypothetical protein